MKLLAFLGGIMGPYVWLALAVALAASHGASYMAGHRSATAAAEQREQVAAAERQAEQLELMRRMQAQVDQARGERDAARQTIAQRDAQLADSARRLADSARGNQRLRHQLAEYAASGTAAATCPGRLAHVSAYAADLAEAATRVGVVAARLAETARVAATERDAYAADIVACVSGWPAANRLVQ
jgi:hypothetical protein